MFKHVCYDVLQANAIRRQNRLCIQQFLTISKVERRRQMLWNHS